MDTQEQQTAPDAAEVRPAELKRVRCLNCPKFFTQSKPWQKFHSDKCRREFHRNEGAFGTLKEKFPKWIAKEVAKQLAAALAKLPVGVTAAEVNNKLLEFDFVSRQELTPEGVALVRAAGRKRRFKEASDRSKAPPPSTSAPPARA